MKTVRLYLMVALLLRAVCTSRSLRDSASVPKICLHNSRLLKLALSFFLSHFNNLTFYHLNRLIDT